MTRKILYCIGLLIYFYALGGIVSCSTLSQNANSNSNNPQSESEAIVGEMKKIKELRGTHIRSPKSSIFSLKGDKFYIQSLEGCKTAVFDTASLTPIKVIEHHFTKDNKSLFQNNENTIFDYVYQPKAKRADQNSFYGKPVESTLSHDGRYLWVTYYRRDYDPNASSPSAVAIIDTSNDEIVRIMPTGPLPKMIAASPDSNKLAVTHWGDNSIGLMDISGENPDNFNYKRLCVSGSRLNMSKIGGNRDNNCGRCLRGTVFSQDGRWLFIAPMGSTGIEVFDTENGKSIGSLAKDVVYSPRHLVLSPDGRTLYATGGNYIYALSIGKMLASLSTSADKEALKKVPVKKLTIGRAARTLAVSPDGNRLYAACNGDSTLYRIDIPSWKVTGRMQVPPYAVGLSLSPDERLAVVTSQGKNGNGGDVVTVYDTGVHHINKK